MGLEEIRKLKEQANLPKPPKRYSIPKISKKRAEKIEREKQERGNGDTELQKWFRAKIKVSAGICAECGCITDTRNYKYAVYTVAHILPKRENMFPSVKTHPLNFIILCPDHHRMFDNANWREREMMNCWPTVWQRLIMVYPDISPEELRHLPVELRDWIEEENDVFGQNFSTPQK